MSTLSPQFRRTCNPSYRRSPHSFDGFVIRRIDVLPRSSDRFVICRYTNGRRITNPAKQKTNKRRITDPAKQGQGTGLQIRRNCPAAPNSHLSSSFRLRLLPSFHLFPYLCTCHPPDGGMGCRQSKASGWPIFLKKTFATPSSDLMKPRKFQRHSDESSVDVYPLRCILHGRSVCAFPSTGERHALCPSICKQWRRLLWLLFLMSTVSEDLIKQG